MVLTKYGERTFLPKKVGAKPWGGKTEDWSQESQALCSEVDTFILKLAGR